MKKIITTILVIVVLGVIGYFGYEYLTTQNQAETLASYQTAIVSRGSLTAYVGATGIVRANQTTQLTWQITGEVGEILVSEGDLVNQDQVLATLSADHLPQSIILAESDLATAQRSLDDLKNSDLARQKAWEAVLAAQRAVVIADQSTSRFDSKTYTDQVDKAREAVLNASDDLNEAEDDFEPYTNWEEENQTRKRYADAVDDARKKYEDLQRSLDLLLMDKDQAVAALETARAQLADAERSYERIKDGPDPADVAVLEARIQSANSTLDLTSIKAPFAATVTDIGILVGDQVSPSKISFRLDDLSRLLVDVRVSEVDINRINVGQAAILEFDAISNKSYDGVVTEVARYGSVTQGVVEFIVTVQLTNADEDVRSGMTAAVNIVVEELNDVLLVPNRAVRSIEGSRVVYRLVNGQLEQVTITLGASSDNNSQVVNGDLRSGDTIVLNPPQVFDTDGPPPFVRR